MDGFNERWWPKRDALDQFQGYLTPNSVTRDEFDKLKAEVAALKDMLKAAKIYDEKTGQPDCESEDKMAKLRDICKLVGVDLDSIIKPKAADQGGAG